MEKIDILLRFQPNETHTEIELAKKFVNLAVVINNSEIDSREKTICIERLEESYMWAKKGLIDIPNEEENEEITYGLV